MRFSACSLKNDNFFKLGVGVASLGLGVLRAHGLGTGSLWNPINLVPKPCP